MAITLRTVTGSALSYLQVDNNFAQLFYSASINQSNLRLHYTGSAGISYAPRYVEISLASGSGFQAITLPSGSTGFTAATPIFFEEGI